MPKKEAIEKSQRFLKTFLEKKISHKMRREISPQKIILFNQFLATNLFIQDDLVETSKCVNQCSQIKFKKRLTKSVGHLRETKQSFLNGKKHSVLASQVRLPNKKVKIEKVQQSCKGLSLDKIFESNIDNLNEQVRELFKIRKIEPIFYKEEKNQLSSKVKKFQKIKKSKETDVHLINAQDFCLVDLNEVLNNRVYNSQGELLEKIKLDWIRFKSDLREVINEIKRYQGKEGYQIKVFIDTNRQRILRIVGFVKPNQLQLNQQ